MTRVERHAPDRSPSRAAGCVAAAAVLLALPLAATTQLPELQSVARSGFSMDLPAWPVETDHDNGATGRHVRVADRMRAEVAWSMDGNADLASLDGVIDAMEEAYAMVRVERRVERPPGQLRLFGLFDFGGRAWLAITQVDCREVGVLATVSTLAPEREQVQRLHGAMLDSFACRSADRPALVNAWPVSDLPDEFGVWLDGSPLLMHRDGRWILIGVLAPASVAGIGADLDKARRAFAAYGEAMQADWSVQAPARQIRNLSGPAYAWTLDSPVFGTVAASAFACGDGASGYVVFAGAAAPGSDADALRALSARFGCPDASARALLERPSACEAGVADLCMEEGNGGK